MVGKKTFIMCHLFFVMFCLTNQPWEALMAFAAPFMLRLALRNDYPLNKETYHGSSVCRTSLPLLR